MTAERYSLFYRLGVEDHGRYNTERAKGNAVTIDAPPDELSEEFAAWMDGWRAHGETLKSDDAKRLWDKLVGDKS